MNGISFNGMHSYDDFNLVLAKTAISPAVPKTTYIDIPGGDGSIDLTEALGEVKYKDRNAEFVFVVFPDDDFEVKKQEINDWLNGANCEITLDVDPDYYYFGRCYVDEYQSQRNQIVIVARLRPYKLAQMETERSFDLTSSPESIKLTNSRMAVCPTIECIGSATIECNGKSFSFASGTHKELDIRLTRGDNYLTISGSGKVIFTYREGAL